MVKPEYKVTGHRLLSKGIVGGGDWGEGCATCPTPPGAYGRGED